MNASRPRVALFVESSSEFGRQVLQGIRRYVQTHAAWSIYWQQRDLNTQLPAWLKEWRGDGIISRSTTPEFVERLQALELPVVDLTDRYEELWLPQIWADHVEIGRLGARHLWERQFKHFAFAGFQGEYWSQLRYQGFRETLQEFQTDCHFYESPWEVLPGQSWDDESAALVEWISALPRPMGILACNDVRGQQVLDACGNAGLSVPEQVAVLGCDNDQIRCELCDPPLSSIIPNAEQIGYRAAELLQQLMEGSPAGSGPSVDSGLEAWREKISPRSVKTRQSTDILAIDDIEIAEAVRLIREQALTGLKIGDLLQRLPISRSTLERGVRKYLKRSPQAEIRRVQLKQACELLTETDLTLPEIAKRCGFQHAEYLSVVFKRELGLPPGQYREQFPTEF